MTGLGLGKIRLLIREKRGFYTEKRGARAFLSVALSYRKSGNP